MPKSTHDLIVEMKNDISWLKRGIVGLYAFAGTLIALKLL
jgi:hypothetical protein